MDFRQYSLALVPQVVQSIDDKLTALTKDFDGMYPEQRTTFANRDVVDEVLQREEYY